MRGRKGEWARKSRGSRKNAESRRGWKTQEGRNVDRTGETRDPKQQRGMDKGKGRGALKRRG